MSNYQVSIEKDEMELVVDVVVTSFVSVKPNSSTWDSDWDYYGYEELEFDVESVVGFDYETENKITLTEDVLTLIRIMTTLRRKFSPR